MALVDVTAPLTWAPGRSISSRGAMCSGGRRGFSRGRRIPPPARRSSRRTPRGDACRGTRASCRGRCNQDISLRR